MSLHLVGYFSSHSSAGDMNSENTEILKPQKYFISRCVLWSTFKKNQPNNKTTKLPSIRLQPQREKKGMEGKRIW